MRPSHPASMLPDTPPSRASPLPQGLRCPTRSPATRSLRLPTSSLTANFARSLPIQRPGLRTRVRCHAATPHDCWRFSTPEFSCYGGCVWETLGSAGSCISGFSACAQLPPICLRTNGTASLMQELQMNAIDPSATPVMPLHLPTNKR